MFPWFGVLIVLMVGFGLGAGVARQTGRLRLARATEQARAETLSATAAINERLAARDQELTGLRERLENLGSDLDRTRGELAIQQQLRATAEERNARIPELERDFQALKELSEVQHADFEGAQRQLVVLRSEHQTTLKAAEEKLALVEKAKEALTDSFRALSAEALQGNAQQFLQLAQGVLKNFQTEATGDLAQRQMAIEGLVRPIKESLGKVDEQIRAMEATGIRRMAVLPSSLRMWPRHRKI